MYFQQQQCWQDYSDSAEHKTTPPGEFPLEYPKTKVVDSPSIKQFTRQCALLFSKKTTDKQVSGVTRQTRMSIAENLKEGESATGGRSVPARMDAAGKLRKQVFIGFGAIVALGLALAGWYVRSRIASEAEKPGPVITTTAPVTPLPPAPAPAPVAVQAAVVPKVEVPQAKPTEPVKPAPRVKPVGPFKRRDADPQPGEKYLQVAAYGPTSLDNYLKKLEAQGLHPLVAPGPSESVFRILIGPYSSATDMAEARHSIQATGIEPIVRNY